MADSPKLSLGTVHVLHAMARGARYGFDIIEETGLTSGTIYPALDRLERLGYAKSRWEDARVAQREKRPPRKYFTITEAGRYALEVAVQRHRALAPLDARGAQPRASDG